MLELAGFAGADESLRLVGHALKEESVCKRATVRSLCEKDRHVKESANKEKK